MARFRVPALGLGSASQGSTKIQRNSSDLSAATSLAISSPSGRSRKIVTASEITAKESPFQQKKVSGDKSKRNFSKKELKNQDKDII